MSIFIKRSVLIATIMLATHSVAEAQLGKKIIGKVAQKTNETLASSPAVPSIRHQSDGNIYYVSIEKGSARAEGSKDAPMKDIQKAIDQAADGDLIRIAQGNYLGTLDRGWIQIKGRLPRRL